MFDLFCKRNIIIISDKGVNKDFYRESQWDTWLCKRESCFQEHVLHVKNIFGVLEGLSLLNCLIYWADLFFQNKFTNWYKSKLLKYLIIIWFFERKSLNLILRKIFCYHKSILLYKVISFFLCVAKDLTNHPNDMVLLYNEASYRSRDGFRLFYVYVKKSWVWF